MICSPSGRPSLSTPAGTEMPGRPAIEAGMVNMSLRYMVTGSSIFSPAAKAAVGAVGVSSTSHFSKACLKSRAIRARICWAFL